MSYLSFYDVHSYISRWPLPNATDSPIWPSKLRRTTYLHDPPVSLGVTMKNPNYILNESNMSCEGYELPKGFNWKTHLLRSSFIHTNQFSNQWLNPHALHIGRHVPLWLNCQSHFGLERGSDCHLWDFSFWRDVMRR